MRPLILDSLHSPSELHRHHQRSVEAATAFITQAIKEDPIFQDHSLVPLEAAIVSSVPQQGATVNCGVFVCHFAEAICFGGLGDSAFSDKPTFHSATPILTRDAMLQVLRERSLWSAAQHDVLHQRAKIPAAALSFLLRKLHIDCIDTMLAYLRPSQRFTFTKNPVVEQPVQPMIQRTKTSVEISDSEDAHAEESETELLHSRRLAYFIGSWLQHNEPSRRWTFNADGVHSYNNSRTGKQYDLTIGPSGDVFFGDGWRCDVKKSSPNIAVWVQDGKDDVTWHREARTVCISGTTGPHTSKVNGQYVSTGGGNGYVEQASVRVVQSKENPRKTPAKKRHRDIMVVPVQRQRQSLKRPRTGFDVDNPFAVASPFQSPQAFFEFARAYAAKYTDFRVLTNVHVKGNTVKVMCSRAGQYSLSLKRQEAAASALARGRSRKRKTLSDQPKCHCPWRVIGRALEWNTQTDGKLKADSKTKIFVSSSDCHLEHRIGDLSLRRSEIIGWAPDGVEDHMQKVLYSYFTKESGAEAVVETLDSLSDLIISFAGFVVHNPQLS